MNVRNKYGDSPMHLAAVQGSEEAMSQLMEGGADIQLGNLDGETPLHRAARFGTYL